MDSGPFLTLVVVSRVNDKLETRLRVVDRLLCLLCLMVSCGVVFTLITAWISRWPVLGWA